MLLEDNENMKEGQEIVGKEKERLETFHPLVHLRWKSH
jgi:hypothetical protein